MSLRDEIEKAVRTAFDCPHGLLRNLYQSRRSRTAISNFSFLISNSIYTMRSQIILLSATGSSIGMPSMSSAC